MVGSSAACMAVAASSQYVVREARDTCTRGQRDFRQVVSLGHIQVYGTVHDHKRTVQVKLTLHCPKV